MSPVRGKPTKQNDETMASAKHTILAAGALLLPWACSTTRAGLLADPGFEDPGADAWVQRTPTDEARTLSRVGDRARSGRHSARIENRADVLSRWRQGHQRTIPIEPGVELRYEAWIAADIPGRGGAFVRLFFMSKAFREVGSRGSQRVLGTCDWRRVVTYAIPPPTAAFAMAYLELQGEGTAHFDDVSLSVVRRPAPPAPPRDILLVTDQDTSSPIVQGITLAAGERLHGSVPPGSFTLESTPDTVRFVVAFPGESVPANALRKELGRFAERGGTVAMDLGCYAAWQGLELRRQPFANNPRLEGTFEGPTGEYTIAAVCVDRREWVSTMWLRVNGRVAGRWLLDESMPSKEDRRVVTRTVSRQRLEPGDRIEVVASPSGPENCAIDRLEFIGPNGEVLVVLQAEEMEGADSYIVSSDKWVQPLEKGMRVWLSRLHTERIEITAEADATRGFAPGQKLFWHGGPLRQSVVGAGEHARTTVLAKREDGGAVMVEQRLGAGKVVALDLAGPPEPFWGRKGGMNKYAFLSNVLGSGTRFGRHVARKPSYDELLTEMRSLATASPLLSMVDEGPGSEGRRVWSLTAGDPARPMFFVSAATHGGEWEPAQGLVCLARYLSEHPGQTTLDLHRYSLKLVPVLSPWAFDKMSRRTPGGVDPNRNAEFGWEGYTDHRTNKDGEYGPHAYGWKGDAPFCVPETQTYKQIIDHYPIHCVIEFHCPAWFISMPATARPDNVDLAEEAKWLFAQELGRRCLFQPRHRRSVGPYALGPLVWMAWSPLLLQYGAQGRYGMLVELPGTFSSDGYASLPVSEIAATTVWAAIRAYSREQP